MTEYKLTYFNIHGIGEPIRWTLKMAGIEFEDERIELADWSVLRNSGRFPLKKLPLLEIDGKVYTQTDAILRYLARKLDLGLHPTDVEANLKVDQVTDILADGRYAFVTFFKETDPVKRQQLKEDLATNFIPSVLKNVIQVIKSPGNKNDGPFITGSKLTWGDLVLANWLQIWQDQINPKLIDNCPTLQRLREAVYAVPQIKAWRAIRPKSDI